MGKNQVLIHLAPVLQVEKLRKPAGMKYVSADINLSIRPFVRTMLCVSGDLIPAGLKTIRATHPSFDAHQEICSFRL